MDRDAALGILKNAILLERRGQAFYAKVAESTSVQAVKDFFTMMAEDEEKHAQVLSDQYRAYLARGSFAPRTGGDQRLPNFASEVLSDRLKREIAAADFEAAAIAAAMGLERNSVKLYADRAQAAEDPEEKALYQWLADWESEHLDFLARVDRELVEAVWADNRFWPL